MDMVRNRELHLTIIVRTFNDGDVDICLESLLF